MPKNAKSIFKTLEDECKEIQCVTMHYMFENGIQLQGYFTLSLEREPSTWLVSTQILRD